MAIHQTTVEEALAVAQEKLAAIRTKEVIDFKIEQQELCRCGSDEAERLGYWRIHEGCPAGQFVLSIEIYWQPVTIEAA